MKKMTVNDILPFNFYRACQDDHSVLILVVRAPHPDNVPDEDKRFDFIPWDLEAARHKNLKHKVISRFCREAGLTTDDPNIQMLPCPALQPANDLRPIFDQKGRQ